MMGGLGFAWPWLAVAFGISAGLVWWLQRRRYQPTRRTVPSLLWLTQTTAGRKGLSLGKKNPRWVHLLLLWCSLGLFCGALGDIRRKLAPKRTILLVDASASMQARVSSASSETRMDRAKTWVSTWAQKGQTSDVALIIALHSQPKALGSFVTLPSLGSQLQSLQAEDAGAPLQEGVSLAVALAQDQPTDIILVSDGGFPQEALYELAQSNPLPPGIHLFFQPIVSSFATNLAITGFGVRQERSQRHAYEAWVQISANAEGPLPPTTLELLQGDHLVESVPLTLSLGETRQWVFSNLVGPGSLLEARLQQPLGKEDALSIDNHAYATIPAPTPLRILLVTQENLYVEGALHALAAGIENQWSLQVVKPSQTSSIAWESVDVVIVDGVSLKVPPTIHAFWLNPPPGASPWQTLSTTKTPLLDVADTRHPATRQIRFNDVNLFQSSVFATMPTDEVLVSSNKRPVWVARKERLSNGTLRKQMALGFDVRQSDLPLRVAFPLLLLNTLDWFTNKPTESIPPWRTGYMWSLALPSHSMNTNPWYIQGPQGPRLLVPALEGHAFYQGTHVGWYTLFQGQQPIYTWGANLEDSVESNLQTVKEISVNHTRLPLPPSSFSIAVVLWPWLVILACILLWIEWLLTRSHR